MPFESEDDARKDWEEFLIRYGEGDVDVKLPRDSEARFDCYLQELGGWLAAPLRLDEEERHKALKKYNEDILQAYKEAGNDLKLDGYTRLAATLCNTPMALLNLLDTDTKWIISEHGLPDWSGKTLPRSQSFCAHTILRRTKDVFVVPDARRDWRFSRMPMVNGELQIQYYMGAPLTTLDGQNIGALCVLDTTSDRHEHSDLQKQGLIDLADTIMRELDLRADRLVAGKAKKVFLSSISHELRSPLHGLLASTELMVDAGKLTPFQESCAKTISNCGRTLYDVIEQVLSFSDNEDLAAKQEKVYLPTFVEEVVDATWAGKSKLKDKKDKFEVLVDIDVTQLRHSFSINRGEIGRIIMNLFGNAIKYTEEGFLSVSLFAKAPAFHQDGKRLQYVSLVFEDSGKGIEKEFIPKLFTPFAQQDRLCEGFGLGMSLVKQLVEKNHGTIDVQSEVGKGTKIAVSLLLETIKDSPTTSNDEFRDLETLRGISFSIYQHAQNPRLSTMLVKICRDTFGMIDVELAAADVIMLIDDKALVSLRGRGLDVPIVIFAHGHAPNPHYANRLQAPIGPTKLGRAILMAMHHHEQKLYQARRCSIVHLDPVSPPTSCAIKEQDPMHNSLLFNDLQVNDSFKPVPLVHSDSVASSVAMSDSTSFSFGRPAYSLLDIDEDKETQSASSFPDRPTCLCVDDNPINLQILAALLTKLDIAYVTATDGKAALDLYTERKGFELVFMDVKMPVMDGIEASRRIREFEESEGVARSTIVALTGAGSSEETQCKSSGVDHFCKKPVSMKDLTKYIESSSVFRPS